MAIRPSYLEFIAKQLKLPTRRSCTAPLAYDLFAGCGGLGLGLEAAGFQTVGFEMLPDACMTYRQNLRGPCNQVMLDESTDLGPKPDLIIGGPPCQPFSVNGHQNGHADDRDGFPAFLSAVERYRPKLAIFENVRGMLFRNKEYLGKIVKRLGSFGYTVEEPRILSAVQYGVPQNRQRLFVVAHHGGWVWPEPSSSQPYTAGEALGDLARAWSNSSKFLTPSMEDYVARYERASKCIRPRDLHLSVPSRTVTCRNLCGATGDMLRIVLPDGRRRRLTVREGARLQSFPDWFEFKGTEEQQLNQIGNAVPPLLSKTLSISALAAVSASTRISPPSSGKKPIRRERLAVA